MKAILEALEKIQNYDVVALARADHFGQNGFQASVEPARRLRNLYCQIDPEILDQLSATAINELNTTIQAVMDQFSTIESATDSNLAVKKESVSNGLKSCYNNSYAHCVVPICLSKLKALDPQKALATLEAQSGELANRLIDQASEMLESVRKEFTDAKSKFDAQSSLLHQRAVEQEQLLKTLRETSAKTGVSDQAKHFANEAKIHDITSWVWLIATIFMSVIILVLAYNSMYLHRNPELTPKNSLESYQLIASKVLIFGVLSYGLVLCGRNFMSHRHNSIVNKHRENALETFKVLAAGATDAKMKDVILTHASACIFSPQETGFSKAPTGGISGGKSVIELIQTATKASD